MTARCPGLVVVDGRCANCGRPTAVYEGQPSHKRGRWRDAGKGGLRLFAKPRVPKTVIVDPGPEVIPGRYDDHVHYRLEFIAIGAFPDMELLSPAEAARRLDFDTLDRLGLCECGIWLDIHPPLAKAKPIGGWTSRLDGLWQRTSTDAQRAYHARQQGARPPGPPIQLSRRSAGRTAPRPPS